MYTSGNKRRRGKDKIAKVALYVSSCLPRPYSLSMSLGYTHWRAVITYFVWKWFPKYTQDLINYMSVKCVSIERIEDERRKHPHPTTHVRCNDEVLISVGFRLNI